MNEIASEIARMLARDVDRVCQELLPNGKHEGAEWRAGSVDGEAGKSLGVCLNGDKAGVWCDFSNPTDSGDLLDLWSLSRGVSLSEAIKQAKEFLGIHEHQFYPAQKKKEYTRPQKPKTIKAIKPDSLTQAYLVNNRKLTEETIAAFKVAEHPNTFTECPDNPANIIFPYLRDGELINIKHLGLLRPNGKKLIHQAKNPEPCLFGWQALDPKTRKVCITEGELDAMSLHQYGAPALSVPNGGGVGGKQDWIEVEYERMARFDEIFLCLDMDKTGLDGAMDIAERLGFYRCRLVSLPHKDANDCLLAGVTVGEMVQCLRDSKYINPKELRDASSYADEVIRLFYPPDDKPVGLPTPWNKIGTKMMFRPSELTVWSGFSSHGKALSLDTPIPTIDGWSNMGELQVGDRVFDENGDPCRVVALSEVWHNRPCYQITFSDGETIVADANHEWLTWNGRVRQTYYHAKRNNRIEDRPLKKRGTDQKHKAYRPSIVTTSQIFETLTEKMGNRISNNHSIPVAGALKIPNRKLHIDPYALGLWLGDGDSSGGGFTTADTDLLCEFSDAGFEVTNRSSKYRYGILGLCAALRKIGTYNNKHIPNIYLRASYDQRLALLQGLMDTDGHATAYGRCEFCAMNRTLAYQVLELVLSMGLQARLITGDATLNGKSCGIKYRVTFTPDIPVFRLKRKADRLRSKISDRTKRRFIVACVPVNSVPVRCIQVDSKSHLYLAGRSMIPTHNSLVLNQIILHGLSLGERACIGSFEMPVPVTLQRLTRQMTCLEKPPVPHIQTAMEWLNNKLWVFDLVGQARIDRVIEVFTYVRQRFGASQFVLDSMTCLGVSDDDYKGQKAVIEKLVEFVNLHKCHMHFVVHPRKGDEYSLPGKMDVKGTGAVTDMAHNVILFWKNKMKSDVRELLETERHRPPTPEEEKKLAEPDAIARVDKQRMNGWESKILLWYDQNSMQCVESAYGPESLPHLYVPCNPEEF